MVTPVEEAHATMNRPGDSDTVTLLFDEQEEVADEEVVEVDKKLTNHYAFPFLVRRLPFTKDAKVSFSGTVAHQVFLKGTVNKKVGHLFEYLSLSDEEKLSKLSAIELAEYIVTLIVALERSPGLFFYKYFERKERRWLATFHRSVTSRKESKTPLL
jgi:hypothetical protein